MSYRTKEIVFDDWKRKTSARTRFNRCRSSIRRRRCSWRIAIDSSFPTPSNREYSNDGNGAIRAWALRRKNEFHRRGFCLTYLNSVKMTGCCCCDCWLSMSRKAPPARISLGGTGGGGGGGKERGTITSLVNSPNFNACWEKRREWKENQRRDLLEFLRNHRLLDWHRVSFVFDLHRRKNSWKTKLILILDKVPSIHKGRWHFRCVQKEKRNVSVYFAGTLCLVFT